jgi:hypothetical protein
VGRPDPIGAPASKVSRLDSRDVWIVLGLLVVSVVVPLIVGAASGTLDIPRNDDWSYRGIASRLFSTGRLELDGAAEAAILGQVLLVQPLLWLSGGAWWAYLGAGLIAASLAVVAGYLLLRLLVDRWAAALGVGLLLLFPAYLAYVISFMSDVPAIAAQFGSLGLASVALRRDGIDNRWLWGSLVLGCLAFSIREFALAAPVAVIAVLIVREPTRRRSWLATVAVGLAVAGILLARFLLPGQLGDVAWEANPIQILLPPAMTLALVLSPVASLAAYRWWPYWLGRDVVVGLAIGGIVTAAILRLGLFPNVLLYDLVTQWGAPAAGNLLGQRPKLFGDEAWATFAVVALVATVVIGGVIGGIAGAHLRRARADRGGFGMRVASPPGLLFVFTILVLAGLSAFGLVGWLFDRYLWPIVPPLAALLLYVPPDLRADPSVGAGRAEAALVRNRPAFLLRGGGAATLLCVAVLGFMSAAFLLNTNAYDGARWRAAARLADQGFDPATVDGGPEWTDSHQTGLAIVANPVEGLKSWHKWWHKSWPDFHLCAYVASSDFRVPDSSLIEVDPEAYRLYLFAGPSAPFYYFRVAPPECPEG